MLRDLWAEFQREKKSDKKSKQTTLIGLINGYEWHEFLQVGVLYMVTQFVTCNNQVSLFMFGFPSAD